MARPNPDTSACDNAVAIDELLEHYNYTIITFARRSILWRAIPAERLPFAIDDLAQNVRLKLWQAMQKKSIDHLEAYIRRLVHNEAVNLLRQERPTSPLPVNEEGELYQDHRSAVPSGGMRDSLEEIEQEEVTADLVATASGVIQHLPPRQQRAMICSLKDRGEDALPLLEALMDRGIDIGRMNWPEDEDDRHRLKASLPAVRKKLRLSLYRPPNAQGTGR